MDKTFCIRWRLPTCRERKERFGRIIRRRGASAAEVISKIARRRLWSGVTFTANADDLAGGYAWTLLGRRVVFHAREVKEGGE